jgi:hypothetical protein
MTRILAIIFAYLASFSYSNPVNDESGRWAHLSWGAVAKKIEDGRVVYTPDVIWVTMDYLVADDIPANDVAYIVSIDNKPVCVSADTYCTVELEQGNCSTFNVVAKQNSTARISAPSTIDVCPLNPPVAPVITTQGASIPVNTIKKRQFVTLSWSPVIKQATAILAVQDGIAGDLSAHGDVVYDLREFQNGDISCAGTVVPCDESWRRGCVFDKDNCGILYGTCVRITGSTACNFNPPESVGGLKANAS